MVELKTTKNEASVAAFLESVADERQRRDCFRLVDIMSEITGAEPAMWGTSIVGFGSYHYVYSSGREGDWMLTGFAPRKQALTMYVMAGFSQSEDLLANLGKFKTGKSCLYVKTLDDIHLPTLEKLIRRSVEEKRASSAGK